MKCENCKEEHNGSYGSGRFCSDKCARGFSTKNKRNEINDKVSITLKSKNVYCEKCERTFAAKNLKQHICNVSYKCEKCEKDFIRKIPFKAAGERIIHIHCEDCIRKVPHSLDDPKSLFGLSLRTAAKILKRANIKCIMCGWDKTALDIHHVIERKNGGTNDHNNLVPLCPNCHRMAHEGKYTKDELLKFTLDKTFANWKDFYHPSN